MPPSSIRKSVVHNASRYKSCGSVKLSKKQSWASLENNLISKLAVVTGSDLKLGI